MIAKLCFITRSRRAEHCFPFCPDTRAVNVFQTKMWSSALSSIFTIHYSLLEPRTKDLHFKKFLLKNTWDKYVKQKYIFSIKEKQREAIHPYLGSNRTPLVQTNPTNQPTRVQKTHICVCICNCIVFYCIFICIWYMHVLLKYAIPGWHDPMGHFQPPGQNWLPNRINVVTKPDI